VLFNSVVSVPNFQLPRVVVVVVVMMVVTMVMVDELVSGPAQQGCQIAQGFG
jgi:hypothetical protein